MKLADSNVWLALVLTGHVHHSAASAWLSQQKTREVAFCRLTQLSLLRLLTTRAVLGPYGIPPLTNSQAWQTYNGLCADSRITFATEHSDIETRWIELANASTSSPRLWMDAYLAAFAISGGHQLVTFDSAFTQFRGLDLLLLQ